MMRHLKRIFTAMVFAIIAVTLSACTTANPATGKSDFTPLMTPSQERQVGASEHPKILKEFGGVYDDPTIGGWVASLGGRLVANSELAKQSQMTSQAACTALRRDFLAKMVHPLRWYTSERL